MSDLHGSPGRGTEQRCLSLIYGESGNLARLPCPAKPRHHSESPAAIRPRPGVPVLLLSTTSGLPIQICEMGTSPGRSLPTGREGAEICMGALKVHVSSLAPGAISAPSSFFFLVFTHVFTGAILLHFRCRLSQLKSFLESARNTTFRLTHGFLPGQGAVGEIWWSRDWNWVWLNWMTVCKWTGEAGGAQGEPIRTAKQHDKANRQHRTACNETLTERWP